MLYIQWQPTQKLWKNASRTWTLQLHEFEQVEFPLQSSCSVFSVCLLWFLCDRLWQLWPWSLGQARYRRQKLGAWWDRPSPHPERKRTVSASETNCHCNKPAHSNECTWMQHMNAEWMHFDVHDVMYAQNISEPRVGGLPSSVTSFCDKNLTNDNGTLHAAIFGQDHQRPHT